MEEGFDTALGFDYGSGGPQDMLLGLANGQGENLVTIDEMLPPIVIADLTLSQCSDTSECTIMDCSKIVSPSDGNASDHQLKLVYEQEDRLSSYSMLLSSTSSESIAPRKEAETTAILSHREENPVIHRNLNLPILETPRSTHSTQQQRPAIKPKVLFPQQDNMICFENETMWCHYSDPSTDEVLHVLYDATVGGSEVNEIPKPVSSVKLDIDSYIQATFKYFNDDYFGGVLVEPLFSEVEIVGERGTCESGEEGGICKPGEECGACRSGFLTNSSNLQLLQLQPTVSSGQGFESAPPLSPGFIHRIIQVDENIGDIFSSQLKRNKSDADDDDDDGWLNDVNVNSDPNSLSRTVTSGLKVQGIPDALKIAANSFFPATLGSSTGKSVISPSLTSTQTQTSINGGNVKSKVEIVQSESLAKLDVASISPVPIPEFENFAPSATTEHDLMLSLIDFSHRKRKAGAGPIFSQENPSRDTFDLTMVKYDMVKTQRNDQQQRERRPVSDLNINGDNQLIITNSSTAGREKSACYKSDRSRRNYLL